MSLAREEVFQQVEVIIKKFLEQTIGWDEPVAHDMSLIDGGLVDSLSIVQIVQALQNRFDIEIAVSDMVVDNFDSVNAIGEFVAAKL